MRQIKGGTLNVSIVIRIIDSTDGTPETGVTSATGGLAFNYRREGAVAVAITAINDLALLTTAHTDGGILHIGDGYYRVDFQDAAFAAGATGVLLTGTATGMVVIGEYVELVAYDSADTVRLGLSALPNAVPDTSGGLATEDASGHLAVDVREWLGTAVTVSATSTKPEVDMNSISDDATAANNLELDYDGTGYAKANSTIGTTTTNTDMRGTDSAALAATWDATLATNIGTTNTLAAGATGFAAIDTVVDAIKVKTDFLPSATAGAAGGVFIAGTNAATTVTTSFTTTFTGNLTGDVQGNVDGTVAGVTPAAAGAQMDLVNAPNATAITAIQSGLATPTNITAGTITTVTNLTNLPTIPTNWITTAGITDGAFTAAKFAASSLDGKGDWNTVVPDAAGTVPIDGSLTVTLAGGVTHGDSTAMLRLGSSGATPAFYVTNSSATINHNAVQFAGGLGQVTGGNGLVLTGGGMLAGIDPGIGFIATDMAVASKLVGARLTSIDTIETDTTTDIPALITTAQTDLDTITGADGVNLLSATQASIDAIETDTGTDGVKLNATQPTGWAANLVASAGQIKIATVDTVTNTHTPTTTEFQADDITEATADHYNGRVVIFTSGVLAGQATSISDYAAVGGIGQFTVVAMTEAPSNNDTFIIV